MGSVKVFKIVNDDADETPTGVQGLNVYRNIDILPDLLDRQLVVIGGTPGGLYNLLKYHPESGRKIPWHFKSFDLVVIDEASQMSVPEAVLASAFLKPDGHMLVVGDHRQMPPIVAHEWEGEFRRTTTAHRPYVSLFETLDEHDFPREGLDESFRLHEVVAEFLNQNIYAHDGIRFFSRRKELLEQPPAVDDYVDVVLSPYYPIVVVEHAEHSSQQYNETEIELAAPLIDVVANRLRLDGLDGVGVVVPHRAQRSMLRQRFPELAVTDAIDTVERFQGGERDVIIV